MLADNGASVTRIDRPSATSKDVLCRGKRSIIIDSKNPSGKELLRKMISSADVLIDPFRPGVLERLGLGPELFLGSDTKKGLNEKLIYARIVGFPRTGPYKDMAGHDINYLALSGILSMLPGSSSKPTFPLNLLADFAGGGVMCALGILLALIQRGTTGRGQVVDVDMVSGTRYLASFPLIHALLPGSLMLGGQRGTNPLDGGAPFYNIYSCKGGGWMSVGCLEPQFFKAFLELFLSSLPPGFSPFGDQWKPNFQSQVNRSEWPKLYEYLEKGFLTNTREYWTNVFHGTDACVAPVLSPVEADALDAGAPAVHPRVSTLSKLRESKPALKYIGALRPGLHTEEILRELGLNDIERARLAADGALGEELRRPSVIAQAKL